MLKGRSLLFESRYQRDGTVKGVTVQSSEIEANVIL